MESEVAGPYQRMQAAFDRLAASKRIWSIQTEQNIDRVKARSWAGIVVARGSAFLGRLAASLVDSDDLPLAMGVRRGRSTAYFYPGFILIDSNQSADVALVDFTELEISAGATNFTETDMLPADAQVVGTTWAKANKNGSRDRRFANNRELPILRYGSLGLSTSGGMNEVFMFSDAEASYRFATAANELKRLLVRGRREGVIKSQPLLGRHE
jgi:hypothetical protein